MTTETTSPRFHAPFTELIDLASETVGGQALATNDDFFAAKENLLLQAAPVFIPGKYTDQGKWMDGWESRRKRGIGPGNDHDWCIVRLGLPGVIRGLNVDTAHFLGNYPEYCSVLACEAPAGVVPGAEGAGGAGGASAAGGAAGSVAWREILPKSRLQGGTGNLFPVSDPGRVTHLLLKIFPDGGVARLRVHGEVRPAASRLAAAAQGPVDLAAAENGGVVVACNDMFFGQKDNLILPGRARTMGDGWETRRKRGPGHDWIIVQLAASGKLRRIEVDTHHFKGNFPESCSIEACAYPARGLLPSDFRDRKDIAWEEILPRTKLQAHHQHFFEKELHAAAAEKKFDYVRLNIFPDGGVSRLRVHGIADA